MNNGVTGQQNVGEQEIIYSELVCLFLETSQEGYVSKDVWGRVNNLLLKMSLINPRYSEYTLSAHNVAESIPVMTFKQKLRSAIGVMCSEFGLEELSDIIKRDRQAASMTFNNHNSAVASPVQSNYQNVNVSVQQRVEMIIKEVKDNLSDEDVEKIKNELEEYNKKPTRSATEKLLRGILGLGNDIAVGVIANIISKQLGVN